MDAAVVTLVIDVLQLSQRGFRVVVILLVCVKREGIVLCCTLGDERDVLNTRVYSNDARRVPWVRSVLVSPWGSHIRHHPGAPHMDIRWYSSYRLFHKLFAVASKMVFGDAK